MKRIAMLWIAAALTASFGFSLAAEADPTLKPGAKPKASAGHVVPMHPHQLTLYPNGRPQPRHAAHSFTRHRFDQPTAVHNTFMGSRYY